MNPLLKRALIVPALALASSLGGCAALNLTAQQQANLELYAQLAKNIGVDAVTVWCASSNIVYVIANDVNAQSRVTAALEKNAKAATDACPMIAAATGINVITEAQASELAAWQSVSASIVSGK